MRWTKERTESRKPQSHATHLSAGAANNHSVGNTASSGPTGAAKGERDMHWDGWGPSGWGFVLMMLMMLVFWGLVVTGIVLLVRSLAGNRPHPARPDEAEWILRERFARGEMNEEEFHRRRDALRYGHRPPGQH